MKIGERDNRLNLNEGAHLQNEENSASKINKLKDLIRKNLPGCDLVLCIFIAALKSFRADKCLRPFPQYFVNEKDEKDFVSLKKSFDKIPPLSEFLRIPAQNIPQDVADLLLWLFFASGIPILTKDSVENLPVSVLNTKASINPVPQHVFEVNYSPKIDETWMKRTRSKTVFYAFHGSPVINFYSILKIGLQQHFSSEKEVIFGNGVYLSNEISICTNYAPFAKTWNHSTIGTKHSIIAVCEVINDEENVKCKDENNRKRALNQNSYGEIPEKYFVVTNSELIKVKYLLVYGNGGPSAVKSFVKKHFLWILIVLYIVMLLMIKLYNMGLWKKSIRLVYFLQKYCLAFNTYLNN
ncbi:protein mono-ADP-ribosyltransferase PARP16 isoform X2 [Dendroctonus ponderosae]|uniref:Poly [ADP-ribose] polymerase n=1 Tax=Dendroctonus ponderosae TaxID=77166 RepID=A0AAR5P1K2_DENPD|nr:protein mono-ADP-ribosyltransferase PARP16 isoform X2 [Dendroctonus ponderosae]